MITEGALAGVAAVQGRIGELQARFTGGSGVAFGTVLAGQLGETRTGASWSPGGGEVPDRLPAGLSPAVDLAQRHLGVPYVWGGETPSGFDCSGLLQYVYRQLGVELPRTAAEQARVGRPVDSLSDARPGDIVAFNDPVDHIGIFAGDGLMVVAPKTGDVVKVQRVYAEPSAIRRVLPAGGEPPGGPIGSGDLVAQRAGLLAALSSLTGAAS